MAGRKRHAVWEFFCETKNENFKGKRAICKKCKKEIVGQVAQMKKHMKICSFVQELLPKSSTGSIELAFSELITM